MDPSAHPRLLIDLEARRQVFGQEEEVVVPEDGVAFWRWYAGMIRLDRPFRLRAVPAPPYPEPWRGCALWFSGGVESTYALHHAAPRTPDLLRIEDHALFESGHRRRGQIHFLCAALASAMGYAEILLGMERADLTLTHAPASRGFLERTPRFAEAWTAYQPGHRLTTLCGHLHKEEILLELRREGLLVTGTCDRLKDGRWCADCYKCFEAFYSAKAVGIDLGFRLSRRAFATYYAEYRRYVDSGFTDNFNNAYAHYVRLQITYGLRFDADADCDA